jgi:hypothetical protein
MFKLSILAIGTLLSFNVFSACSANSCSGVGKNALISVYPNSSGNIYLQAGAGKENLDCKLIEGHYMVLKSDHPVFEAAYSTILTALSSQKSLTVRIKNGSPICEVSYVRMFM